MPRHQAAGDGGRPLRVAATVLIWASVGRALGGLVGQVAADLGTSRAWYVRLQLLERSQGPYTALVLFAGILAGLMPVSGAAAWRRRDQVLAVASAAGGLVLCVYAAGIIGFIAEYAVFVGRGGRVVRTASTLAALSEASTGAGVAGVTAWLAALSRRTSE